MFGFNFGKDKWFKILNKQYFKGNLESPYENLFYYYQFIINRPYIKESNIKSHFYLFLLSIERDDLNELDYDLHSVLPQNLYDNFYEAMKEYHALTKNLDCDNLEYDEETKLVACFKKYDDYVNENFKDMEDILKDCLLKK